MAPASSPSTIFGLDSTLAIALIAGVSGGIILAVAAVMIWYYYRRYKEEVSDIQHVAFLLGKSTTKKAGSKKDSLREPLNPSRRVDGQSSRPIETFDSY